MGIGHYTIRRASRVDAAQIIAGINAVCAEGQYFSTPEYIPTPQWETVLRAPENAPNHLLYVAELDDQIIGAAQILPDAIRSNEGVLGIFVLQAYRNHGIGSQLLAKLLKDAKLHYNKIVLYVLATNNRAIHLFQKMGFREYERRLYRYAYLGMQEQIGMQLEL